jgi:hypothetical protein
VREARQLIKQHRRYPERAKRAAAHATDDLATPAGDFIDAIERTERPTPVL